MLNLVLSGVLLGTATVSPQAESGDDAPNAAPPVSEDAPVVSAPVQPSDDLSIGPVEGEPEVESSVDDEAVGGCPEAPTDADAPEPRDEPEEVSGRGLMAAGWSLFGGSYLNMVIGGVVLAGGDQRRVGQRMMIPMVGPFIAAASVDPPLQKVMLSVAGVAQFAGVAKIIIGTVIYARWANKQPEEVSLLPMPMVAGGGAQLRYRF